VTSISYELESAIRLHDAGQRYLDLIDGNWSQQLSQHGYPNITNTVNQGCMSLSTYYLEYGRHLGQLRRRRLRRAYAHTSNIASHDNHEEINSWPWVSFSFLYEYGAPLGGPSGRQNSAIKMVIRLPLMDAEFIIGSRDKTVWFKFLYSF